MSKRIKRVYIVISICMVILLAFLVCPPLMFWNKPDMFWGAFPASEVFLFIDCILQCVVMIIGIAVENKIDKEEYEMRKRGEAIEY